MNKQTLKNLTVAHAWLGLIISGVLMIVFLCGTLSFFRTNIATWDQYYNPVKTLGQINHTAVDVAEYVFEQHPLVHKDHTLSIRYPSDDWPFFSADFRQQDDENVSLYLTPDTLTPVEVDMDRHYLGNMLYRLHINLLLPMGRELVGLVSLLFFVVLISGVLIHLKKLVSHFYQYRTGKSKDSYLDGHNLIGVTALPYTVIYALTGVMFNLGIVFQAGFGFAVFQGDIDKLIDVAGFPKQHQIETSDAPLDVRQLAAAIDDANARHATLAPSFLTIHGFNEHNAIATITLTGEHQLANRATLSYQLNDGTLIQEVTPDNHAFSATSDTLESLHIGSFGGVSLRLVYFALGLACCYLILTGNLIWIQKRQHNRKQNVRGMRVVKAMTIALSTGTVIAVGLSFVATRFVPAEWARTDFLGYVFAGGLLLALLHGYLFRDARRAMLTQLRVAAGILLLCPGYDLLLTLASQAPDAPVRIDVLLVNVCLLLVSGLCYAIARYNSAEPVLVELSGQVVEAP